MPGMTQAGLDENWRVLRGLLPPGWEQSAERSGAVRRLRGFGSVAALLRALLLHVGRGYSLRETAVQVKAAGLAQVSDVALLKRLRNSELWLRDLCLRLLQESGVSMPDKAAERKLRVVDATLVKEPGPTGSQWKLHYSLLLPELVCDFFELTSMEGKGTGETFRRFPVGEGDLILGDAGYCCGPGIQHVQERRGYLLVRLNAQAVRLQSPASRRFDLLGRLAKLTEAGRMREWMARVVTPNGSVLGRICALRKSQEQILRAHRKLKRRATRSRIVRRAETWEYTKYVLVFTTLPRSLFTTAEVLEWYRVRWQIELLFKRLKSVAALGHLPKYDEQSARAWLYGKLLVALLAQKLARIGRAFSPWGYLLPAATQEE